MKEHHTKIGLQVMIGCMVETSYAVTASAHLIPLVTWYDFDGNLLIRNDAFRGVMLESGKIMLPHTPGIGIVKTG